MSNFDSIPPLPLPGGVRSRIIDGVNGLGVHLLEAGFESQNRPSILLLHGFPELAFSWRKVMPPLAEAGFYVIAPDLRGYGRTTGADCRYQGDLSQYGPLNFVSDQLQLLAALGLSEVSVVVGHDFGSSVAANCALTRADIFQSVVLMSAPCAPLPSLTQLTATARSRQGGIKGLHDPALQTALASLVPARKHYQWYYSEPQANNDMLHCQQGLHAFLRAYYHYKSADWKANKPFALKDWSAEQLSVLPTYYVMDKDKDMAETVTDFMPSEEHIANCAWLPDAELDIYTAEYSRTGFQGGLQSYRVITSGMFIQQLALFAGHAIEVPACFIAGSSDWGIHQKPGSIEAMEQQSCTDYRGTHLIDNAGHWVQQEQPGAVVQQLLSFLEQLN